LGLVCFARNSFLFRVRVFLNKFSPPPIPFFFLFRGFSPPQGAFRGGQFSPGGPRGGLPKGFFGAQKKRFDFFPASKGGQKPPHIIFVKKKNPWGFKQTRGRGKNPWVPGLSFWGGQKKLFDFRIFFFFSGRGFLSFKFQGGFLGKNKFFFLFFPRGGGK